MSPDYIYVVRGLGPKRFSCGVVDFTKVLPADTPLSRATNRGWRMSTDTFDTPYSRLVSGFADQLNIHPSEADALMQSIHASGTGTQEHESLDHLELLIAVSLNAKLRNAQDDVRFKRLKFLLRNNNARAMKLAERWVNHKATFEEMLAAL